MKGAALQCRPAFSLMGQEDAGAFQHLRLPSWLFSEPRFQALGLEAKVAYTFLLNRFWLSQRNGWVNPEGEVFVVYTRAAMARDLRVSEKRAAACFRALAAAGLIFEKRLGQGRPNQIYLAALPQLCGADAEGQVLEVSDAPGEGLISAACAEVPPKALPQPEAEPRPAQNCQNGGSRTAKTEVPEPPKRQVKKKENQKERAEVIPSWTEEQYDAWRLEQILDRCELEVLEPGYAQLARYAVERLFYAKQYKTGGTALPRELVRRTLWRLDGAVLEDVYLKLRANTSTDVKSPLAYLQAVLLNAVWERDAAHHLDPDVNFARHLRAGLARGG